MRNELIGNETEITSLIFKIRIFGEFLRLNVSQKL